MIFMSNASILSSLSESSSVGYHKTSNL